MKLPIVWLSFLTACFCCSLGPRFGEAGGYPWPSAAGEGDSGDVDTELRLAPLRPHPAAEHKAPSGHQASDEKGKQPETRDFLELMVPHKAPSPSPSPSSSSSSSKQNSLTSQQHSQQLAQDQWSSSSTVIHYPPPPPPLHQKASLHHGLLGGEHWQQAPPVQPWFSAVEDGGGWNWEIAQAAQKHTPSRARFLTVVEPDGVKKYQCEYCGHEFTSTQAIGGHMNAHKVDRAAVAGAATRRQLQQHLQNLQWIMPRPAEAAATSPAAGSQLPPPPPAANSRLLYLHQGTTSANLVPANANHHPSAGLFRNPQRFHPYGRSLHAFQPQPRKK